MAGFFARIAAFAGAPAALHGMRGLSLDDLMPQFIFDAFSLREPVPTSLENALTCHGDSHDDRKTTPV
jgi:hypothetical protein